MGWVTVERGRIRFSLSSYLFIASTLSVWATATWIAHGLKPIAGLQYGLQKNTLGDLIVIAVLTAHFAQDWISMTDRSVRLLKYLCIVGVIATGSRQAMIQLVVAIVIVTMRNHHRDGNRKGSRKSIVMFSSLALIGVVVYTSVSNEFASNNTSSSFAVRTASYTQTLQIWHASFLFGVGERYWYTGHFPGSFQPPNAEIGVLATGGLVDLKSVVAMVLGSLWMCVWQLRYDRFAGSGGHGGTYHGGSVRYILGHGHRLGSLDYFRHGVCCLSRSMLVQQSWPRIPARRETSFIEARLIVFDGLGTFRDIFVNVRNSRWGGLSPIHY